MSLALTSFLVGGMSFSRRRGHPHSGEYYAIDSRSQRQRTRRRAIPSCRPGNLPWPDAVRSADDRRAATPAGEVDPFRPSR